MLVYAIRIAVVLSVCGFACCDTCSALSIIASTHSKVMVLGEPIKIKVEIKNETEDEYYNVPEINLYDENYEFIYLVVTDPTGKSTRRSHRYSSKLRIINFNYVGEVLEPGESIVFFIYPNITYDTETNVDLEQTFRMPGHYQIRICYFVDDAHTVLYKGGVGGVCSESLRIEFLEPIGIEREIMEAVWKKPRESLRVEETSLLYQFMCNVSALEIIVGKYPSHELTRHATLILARERIGSFREGDDYTKIEEAITWLQGIVRESPSFRYEECRLHLAKCMIRQGRIADAESIYNVMLQERPYLENHYDFMRAKIRLESGESGIKEWRIGRKANDIIPNE